jgi:hypothetical protein
VMRRCERAASEKVGFGRSQETAGVVASLCLWVEAAAYMGGRSIGGGGKAELESGRGWLARVSTLRGARG